jgi:hypothetical protein
VKIELPGYTGEDLVVGSEGGESKGPMDESAPKPYKSKFSESDLFQPDVMEQVKTFVNSDEQIKAFGVSEDQAISIRQELDYPFVISKDAVLAFGKVITQRKTHITVELSQNSDLKKFYKLMEVADQEQIIKVVILVVNESPDSE